MHLRNFAPSTFLQGLANGRESVGSTCLPPGIGAWNLRDIRSVGLESAWSSLKLWWHLVKSGDRQEQRIWSQHITADKGPMEKLDWTSRVNYLLENSTLEAQTEKFSAFFWQWKLSLEASYRISSSWFPNGFLHGFFQVLLSFGFKFC